MTDFVQTTLFGPKDSLPSGDPEKIILGADFDVEFANLVTSIASKADDADLATTDANVAANASAIMSNTAAIADNAAAIEAAASPVQLVARESISVLSTSVAPVDDPLLSGAIALDTSEFYSFEVFLTLASPTEADVAIRLVSDSGMPLFGDVVVTTASNVVPAPPGTVFADTDLNVPIMVGVTGTTLVHMVGSLSFVGSPPPSITTLDITYSTAEPEIVTVLQGSWVKVTQATV